MLFRSGRNTAAIVTLDLIETGGTTQVRERIQKELGIPVSHIIICTSHDHSTLSSLMLLTSTPGTLSEIQRVSSHGKSPWSFAIDPTGRWMLVTNESSDSVTEFGVDPATGNLHATSESLAIPKPLTVTFYPD